MPSIIFFPFGSCTPGSSTEPASQVTLPWGHRRHFAAIPGWLSCQPIHYNHSHGTVAPVLLPIHRLPGDHSSTSHLTNAQLQQRSHLLSLLPSCRG